MDLCALHNPSRPSAKEIYESSAKFDKIKTAYPLETLEQFQTTSGQSAPLDAEQTNQLARNEVKAMIDGLAAAYGWRSYGMKESFDAFSSQRTGDDGQRIEHNSQSMVLGGGTRKF